MTPPGVQSAPSRPVDRPGERGVALVIVLLFAALLSGLAAATLQSAASGARAASVFLDVMRADELGRAAGNAVAYHILSGGPGAWRGGAFALHLDRADIEVSYRSESARIDLNHGPVELIAAALTAAGADPSAVAVVSTRVAAQREAAHPRSPSAADVLAAVTASIKRGAGAAPDTGGAPGLALIEDPGQEVAQWNLPPEVAARVLPAFTVANGSATVDPVLADGLVLTALLGDEERAADYRERRAIGFSDTGAALALLPIPMQSHAGFADVSAVRALVRVTVAHRLQRRYDIVLDPPAFAGQSPSVLSWRPLF